MKDKNLILNSKNTFSNDLISVVIPAYNRSNTIERAIRSVEFQTYPYWEAIVVDDGSTDNTAEVVSGLVKKNKKISMIRHTFNQGAQTARNTGIKAAKGKWIAFLDSDDQWLPHSLEMRLELAKREKVCVVHSACYVNYEDGIRKPYEGVRPIVGHVYKKLLGGEGPTFPGLLVSKYALRRIGYLDEKIVAFQEWDTSIRLAKYFLFGFVSQPTFIWNYGTENSISKQKLAKIKGYKQVVRKNIIFILIYGGPKTLARHCQLIARSYKKARKDNIALIYTFIAINLFYLDQRIILQKIKKVFSRLIKIKRFRLIDIQRSDKQ